MPTFLRLILVASVAFTLGWTLDVVTGAEAPVPARTVERVDAAPMAADVVVEVPENTDPTIVEILKNEHGWTATRGDGCECLYGQAIGVYDVPGGFLIVLPDSSAIYLPELNEDV